MLRGRISVLKSPDRILVFFLPQRDSWHRARCPRKSALEPRCAPAWPSIPGTRSGWWWIWWSPSDTRSPAMPGARIRPDPPDRNQARRYPPPPKAAQARGGFAQDRLDVLRFERALPGQAVRQLPLRQLHLRQDRHLFPLKRKFNTTLVFHDGYGAFVGNLRIVDPGQGQRDRSQPRTPSPSTFSASLFDYSAQVPWEIEFPTKGFYSPGILTFNGEDVLEHRFYVGHGQRRQAWKSRRLGNNARTTRAIPAPGPQGTRALAFPPLCPMLFKSFLTLPMLLPSGQGRGGQGCRTVRASGSTASGAPSRSFVAASVIGRVAPPLRRVLRGRGCGAGCP